MKNQKRKNNQVGRPGQGNQEGVTGLDHLLQKSASLHHHLCPRQVLGVRMGLHAGTVLGLDLPQVDKRLLTISETDGCAVDGISVATNCWVGRRTLRIEDYGKIAATFIDTETGAAVRIIPCLESRALAPTYAPESCSKWEAQLIGYQHIPAEILLTVQRVQLLTPIEQILSSPGKKAVCDLCGEEIINEREITFKGAVLCRSCAGHSYYRLDSSERLGVFPIQSETARE